MDPAMLQAIMQQARSPVTPAGDVVPFPNPLGASANQLDPSQMARLRDLQKQHGLGDDMLKFMIAQYMQQAGK